MPNPHRLAIVSTHPIQYYAPWFRHLASQPNLEIKVFYLWDFGIAERKDAGFKKSFAWDIPLLEGYPYEFIQNASHDPGTHRFGGISNPDLLRAMKVFRPDAILLFGYKFASLFRLIFSKLGREVPLLFRGDSHRLLPRSSIKEAIRRKLISSVYRRFSAFLFVGQANRAYFAYHKIPERKLFFAPHAIDNERFLNAAEAARSEARQWRKELGIPENHRVVLFAGKFEFKKRPLDLLRAFVNLQPEGVSLLFVGGGELEQRLKEAALRTPNVYFAPFQNQTQMPRTYSAADVLVLPSFGSGETWGLAVNEAMCMGKPVIVSSHVGCAQDLVIEGETGWCFQAGDAEALKDRLGHALGPATDLRQVGLQAQSHLVKTYNYANATKGLTQALSYVLSA